MMSSHFMVIFSKVVLDVEGDEWNHVVNDGHVDVSLELVVHSCKLMEKCSLTPFEILSFVHVLWWMVAYGLEVVVSEGFEVELRDLHDYVQCDEMNDANFNFDLEG